MTFIETIQKEKLHVLQLDSGDLFLKRDASPETEDVRRNALIISKAFMRMGVDAINVGDRDLLMGIEFLEEEFRKGLPLISSNIVRRKDRRPIFAPYLIKDVSHVKFGIFGICPAILAMSQKNAPQDLLVDDPYRVAKEVVNELKNRADIIICLSDLGLKGDQILARDVKEIHFILGGHDGLYLKEPVAIGSTFIFQHYQKGMYVGRIDLTIEGKTSSFQDSGLAERLTQELNRINERIRYTEGLKKSQAIEKHLRGLYQRREELEGKLMEAKRNPPRGSRFHHRIVPLSSDLQEHRDWRSILSAVSIPNHRQICPSDS